MAINTPNSTEDDQPNFQCLPDQTLSKLIGQEVNLSTILYYLLKEKKKCNGNVLFYLTKNGKMCRFKALF